jgi:hypothetical protein
VKRLLPVFMDGEKVATLRGDNITEEYKAMIENMLKRIMQCVINSCHAIFRRDLHVNRFVFGNIICMRH